MRIVREGDEFGGLQNIERHVVLNRTHGDAMNDELEHDDEDQDCGNKSAGRGQGEWTKNVLEQNSCVVAPPAHAAGEVLCGRRLGSGNANAHREVRRRKTPGNAR